MKTSNVSLTILAHEPEKTPFNREDIPILIRTEDGNLMANRVRSLLREYGDRIQVPAALVLEILEDRNRKSGKLKAAKRDLESYEASYVQAVELLCALHSESTAMIDAMINAPADSPIHKITAELEALNAVLDETGGFLDEILEEDCDD